MNYSTTTYYLNSPASPQRYCPIINSVQQTINQFTSLHSTPFHTPKCTPLPTLILMSIWILAPVHYCAIIPSPHSQHPHPQIPHSSTSRIVNINDGIAVTAYLQCMHSHSSPTSLPPSAAKHHFAPTSQICYQQHQSQSQP